MKSIAVVTASRADYGVYLPVFKALTDAKFNWDLYFLGDTSYIDADIFNERATTGFSENTKAVLVLGDTMPMLQAGMWAAERNMTVCHIHGGDTTGSIDNKIRYAISALADWHFPSLPQHGLKLEAMGYPSERIKVVGPLGIYAMKDADFIPEKELRVKLGLSDKPIIIVIQHPVSTEREQAGEQIRETIRGARGFDAQMVVIAPNGELGSEMMVEVIKEHNCKFFDNLPYLEFINLLNISKVIVGNSSCGLVEAPLFGVPCVNIGTRQGERVAGGLIYNVGYHSESIKAAIEDALTSPLGFPNAYKLDIDGPGIIVKTLEAI